MASKETGLARMNRRKLSWSEREKNKMRDRRRRAITSNIYAGLRAQGNYNLSKHCDNNEILKALCAETGWTVEEDGTIYQKGCKPPPPGDGAGSSTAGNAPSSSSLQTPSPFDSNINSPILCTPNVPFPPLHLWISSSAPVTPPIESPKPPSSSIGPLYSAASSTPATPTTQCHEYAQWMNFQEFAPSASYKAVTFPAPTFNSIGPAAAGMVQEMRNSGAEEGGQVKPWVGERIHEVALNDDLELTLATGAKSSTA